MYDELRFRTHALSVMRSMLYRQIAANLMLLSSFAALPTVFCSLYLPNPAFEDSKNDFESYETLSISIPKLTSGRILNTLRAEIHGQIDFARVCV